MLHPVASNCSRSVAAAPRRTDRPAWHLAWAGLALAVACSGGCTASGPERSAAGPAPSAARAAHCATLTHPAADGVTIDEAVWIEAGPLRAADPVTGLDHAIELPAHCRVRGRADARTGSDGEAYRTAFELRLPAAEARRLLYQGGDGLDGVVQPALGRNTGAHGWVGHALGRGFAVVSSDGGHAAPTALFGLDAAAREAHAWRAHVRVFTIAAALFARHYGHAPAHRYALGCGGGGRQAMMLAQRMGELVDGVLAVSPSMREAQGAAVAAAWSRQLLGRAGLEPSQLERVAQEIVDRCDAADGLADGLVTDMALCRIRIDRLSCPGAGAGCLRPEQARALAAAMAGPTSTDGTALYAAWPWDPGIGTAAWWAWKSGQRGRHGVGAPDPAPRAASLGLVFATPPDATLTAATLDFDRDPLRLAAAQRLHGTADDVTLRAFRQHGGKLMLLHGAADPVNSALDTVDYQLRLEAAHGAAQASRFARTFIVPGMNHCLGGPATDDFDGLAALVRWVEQGQAPERLVATSTTQWPGRARPLCPYPRIARYLGGDSERAESFECR